MPTRKRRTNRGAVQFRAYLEAEDLSHSRAAKRFDVSRAYVGNLASGRMRPGLKLAAMIEKLTGGSVSATAWYEPA